MAKRLLSYDPVTGIREYTDYDPDTDTLYIHHEQDVSGILELNQKMRNDDDYKKQGIKDDWYHFATVPMSVVLEIKNKYGLDVFKDEDLPKIEKILSTRDYTKCRTVNRI